MRNRSVEIRCPKCRWKPLASSLWSCGPSCRHSWNTFDTAGICPACGRAWKMTQCLRCGAWSPHPDWYREDDGQASERQSEGVSSRDLIALTNRAASAPSTSR